MNISKLLDSLYNEAKNPVYLSAIELFARDGTSATRDWAPKCNYIAACDVNSDYLESFAEHYPASSCFCLDSVDALKSGKILSLLGDRKFDFVSSDNPQGFYGNNYCEHFDFIDRLPLLCGKGGFLYFIVNLRPFKPTSKAHSRDSYLPFGEKGWDSWMNLRSEFYGRPVLTKGEAVRFYLDKFESLGFPVEMAFWKMRPSALEGHPDHLMYLLLKLKD